MNEVNTIQNVCVDRLLDPKWLIVPSSRTGTSWIEFIVRSGTPCVHLTPATLRQFALELAGPLLAKRGLTVLDDAIGPLIVDWAWSRLDHGYFSTLKKSPGLLSSVSRTIEQLRMHGISAEDLRSASSDRGDAIPEAKATDLGVLLNAWNDYLREYHIADQADVLRLAGQAVESGALSPDSVVLTAKDLTFSGLELQLMNAVPPKQRVTVDSPLAAPAASTEDESATSFSLRSENVNFVRAIGEANEIREVFRRCVAEELPLDDVEILQADSATYVPLACDLSATIKPPDTVGLPITFHDGLPVTMSRPVRALQSWMRWIEGGHQQQQLVEMFAAGLLDCGGFGSSVMAKLLRPLGIRLGSSNYTPKLDEQLQTTETRIAATDHDDPEIQAQRIGFLEKKQQQLGVLKAKIETLLALSDRFVGENTEDALSAVHTFLAEAALSVNELDHVSVTVFGEQVEERKRWISSLGLNVDVASLVDQLCEQVRVMGSGPQPGRVHVAPLNAGGHTGRKYTFIVGMDDRRFPGALMQDPILLDHERRSLSDDFPDSSTRMNQALVDVRHKLSQFHGDLTLLWSCHSVRNDTEMFATPLVLEVYRQASGDSDADMRILNQAAGAAVSFAPDDRRKAITASEHWLWQLTEPGFNRDDQTAFVCESYEHLERGNAAVQDRFQRFGSWSGHVPGAADHVKPFDDDGTVYSASALEKLGACPLAYFFQRRLGLFPPDEPSDDPDVWLDARQFGSLLHELFRSFMAELTAEGQLPAFDDHYPRLLELLRDLITEYRRLIPPPNDSALRRDSSKLILIARTFLQDEESNCRALRPLYFETALGMTQSGFANQLDSEEPPSVDLGDNLKIRVRGQIDRIDQVSELVYSICDYKTGSARSYAANAPFRNGRRVQNVLYLKMVEQVLREKVDPQARVAQFEYFFPGTKASGLRRAWSAEQLNGGLTVLTHLTSLDSAGVYPPTDDDNDCRYCDYQEVCGDYKRLTRQSKRWLDDSSVEVLADFRELRND